MLDIYLSIFYTVCTSFAALILPVFAIYLILSLTSSLLFKER